jgi:hypothetical protein
MFIDQASKVIFFHIPKTGGRSIKKTFGFVESETDKRLSHFYPDTAQEVIFQNTWHHYWKFTIVRNPWDRYVSLYEFHRQSEHTKIHLPLLREYALSFTFDEWMYANYNRVIYTDWFNSPQYRWWAGCDRVFKFEDLKQAYSEVSSYIRPVGPLAHENSTERKSYQEYYKKPITIDLVAKNEARTIDLMGYTFE